MYPSELFSSLFGSFWPCQASAGRPFRSARPQVLTAGVISALGRHHRLGAARNCLSEAED